MYYWGCGKTASSLTFQVTSTWMNKTPKKILQSCPPEVLLVSLQDAVPSRAYLVNMKLNCQQPGFQRYINQAE